MTLDLTHAPIADVTARSRRSAGLVKGAAAESSERAAKPTLDEIEHRMHNLARRRWAPAITSQPAADRLAIAVNSKSRSR